MNKDITPALRLKQLIEKKRISIRKFAELCDCNPATISRILNSKCPISSKLLERFSDILGVSKEYIMCETDDPNPKENFLDVLESTKQKLIVETTLAHFNNLGFHITEKVQLGNKLYERYMDNNFYLSEDESIPLSDDELCSIILSSSEAAQHIFAVPKSVNPDMISIIMGEKELSEEKHISAEEFYNFIRNFITITNAYLYPYSVRNTIVNPQNAIDRAIEKASKSTD